MPERCERRTLPPAPPPFFSLTMFHSRMLRRFPTKGDLTTRTPPAASATCRRRRPPRLLSSRVYSGLPLHPIVGFLPENALPLLSLSSPTWFPCLSFPLGERADNPMPSAQTVDFLLTTAGHQQMFLGLVVKRIRDSVN